MKLPKSKCERIEKPTKAFHKESFRWVSKSPGVYLLIGCPKVLDRGGRKIKTKWSKAAPAGTQCRVASTGAQAGTRVHAVVKAATGGRCPVRFKRA